MLSNNSSKMNQINKFVILSDDEIEPFQIKLYGKNPNSTDAFALVSPNKVPHIIEHKWYLGKTGYPYAYIDGGRIQLHQYVWFLEKGKLPHKDEKLYIDHTNRNKLDATDGNLRLATPAENSYNKTSRSKTIDPTNGEPLHHIKWTKLGYIVTLSKDGITNTIDKIASLEEAKEIYNMVATEMFGEFAVLYKQ